MEVYCVECHKNPMKKRFNICSVCYDEKLTTSKNKFLKSHSFKELETKKNSQLACNFCCNHRNKGMDICSDCMNQYLKMIEENIKEKHWYC